jgi:hypothetical protein
VGPRPEHRERATLRSFWCMKALNSRRRCAGNSRPVTSTWCTSTAGPAALSTARAPPAHGMSHHNAESVLLDRRDRARVRPPCGVHASSGDPACAGGIRAAAAVRCQRHRVRGRYCALARAGPSAHFTSIPNGVDTGYLHAVQQWASARLRMSWEARPGSPTSMGWSGLPQNSSRACLKWNRSAGRRWAGSPIAEHARFGTLPGVHFNRYVDDIRPHVHSAACFIAPLRLEGVPVSESWMRGPWDAGRCDQRRCRRARCGARR